MSFLAGILSGTENALQRRVAQTRQDRADRAASRRYATQLAREDLRNAVADQQWQQVYDQRGDHFNRRLTHDLAMQGNLFDHQKGMQQAGFTHDATMQGDLFDHQKGMQQAGFGHDITMQGNLFQHQKGMQQAGFGHDTAMQGNLFQHQKGMQQAGFGHDITMQGNLFKHQGGLQQGRLAHEMQIHGGNLALRQDELAQRIAEAGDLDWYRRSQNALGWAELKARKDAGYYNRSGSGRPDGLSTQAYESIKNMADVFARTQNNSGAIQFWFDPKKSVLQQARDLESMGAAIMNQLMTSTGNDAVEALKGLPVFWSHMITAGKEGEYGEELQRDLLSGITPGNEYQRFDAMYNAVMRGALASIGQSLPQADSGITELQNDQPQKEWPGLVRPYPGL